MTQLTTTHTQGSLGISDLDAVVAQRLRSVAGCIFFNKPFVMLHSHVFRWYLGHDISGQSIEQMQTSLRLNKWEVELSFS